MMYKQLPYKEKVHEHVQLFLVLRKLLIHTQLSLSLLMKLKRIQIM